MNQDFKGWEHVAQHLRERVTEEEQRASEKGEDATRLNVGQRASLRAIASRIPKNGVVIADEVGMGKTRIAVELTRCVLQSGGRVAILVPPGLGYQWQVELRERGIPDVPNILRSLRTYLDAWSDEPQPWFEKPTVMVSHAFTNWRLSAEAAVWRWALVPELYARWRQKTAGRLPRGYHDNEILRHGKLCKALAMSVLDAAPESRDHPVRRLLAKFDQIPWPESLEAAEYSKDGALRHWLERCVGIGLGMFDLIITDEAHKSRGAETGLSRLLERVIVSSDDARRLALTATPVELDVSQWHSTLKRIGLDSTALAEVQEATNQYAKSVKRLQMAWRSSPEARAAYKNAAARFQQALSPYIVRRDKREDPEVIRFHSYSELPINAYRKETEVSVRTEELPLAWRKAICAAESLSTVTLGVNDPVAKRLRLTLGNGHGIATLLDQVNQVDDDPERETSDDRSEKFEKAVDLKRQERAEWWLHVLGRAFARDGDESLFDHPAIMTAVEEIEKEIRNGGKVLVFGRFIRPLRALVNLLNAREMLRRIEAGEPWPQSKVHGESHGDVENSEWPAVRAAHRQIHSPLLLDTLNEKLKFQYERERHRREAFRDRLIGEIGQGWSRDAGDDYDYAKAMFDEFKRIGSSSKAEDDGEESSLALVARAMAELLEHPDAGPVEYTRSFCDLIVAARDTDDADTEDEIEADEAVRHWEEIRDRLREEYARTQGGFARLMYGGTAHASRRMIQLAFNRTNSFPRVLVAQSRVGREGLNLHKACRTVILLHPEWNPGVVEQQIGRVDRVGSRWCNDLRKALASGTPAAELPRIEIRPVVFLGTYDEHNWKVLRERLSNLRAQLHGDVLSLDRDSLSEEDKERGCPKNCVNVLRRE
ncbi:MAG: DEAD/DEAH box helicase [Bryobacteraceae bacterium]|nr:DEAD/DEAH box helicase [Bryobacteraceae bacterium]